MGLFQANNSNKVHKIYYVKTNIQATKNITIYNGP